MTEQLNGTKLISTRCVLSLVEITDVRLWRTNHEVIIYYFLVIGKVSTPNPQVIQGQL